MTTETEHTIERAILALHSQDGDMARYRNAVGFNGSDTRFGNSLAFQLKRGRRLSDRQKAAAYRMLSKYAEQLRRDHGVEYREILEPVAAAKAEVTGAAELEDGRIVAVGFSGYPGTLLSLVKGIPGARWHPAAKVWRFPLTPQAMSYVEAWPPAITVGPALKARMAEVERESEVSEAASRATDAELDLPFAHELYGFQRAGVAYALEHGRTMFGDEMGLGKTVQALATVEMQDAYPVLVVTPAVVKLNWQRELNGPRINPPYEGWLPHRGVTILEGRKPGPLNGDDVVIVNYDVLGGWADTLTKHGFRSIIFDESHYLKNGKAKRTKAAKAISKTIPLRLMLTGTPVLNRPVELISQLDVLGRLEEFGGFWGFAHRYCAAFKDTFGWNLKGASNLDELHSKLRATCFVRRTKAAVLGDLPPKQRITVPIDFDRTHYRKVEAELKVWLKKRLLEDSEWTAKIERLLKGNGRHPDGEIMDAQAEMEAREKWRRLGRAEALVKIEALKQTAAEGKLEPVTEWIREFLDAGRKLVVFAHHRKIVDGIADAIREAGFGVVTLTGSTTGDARQSVVDRFQTDPEVRLMVANMQAGGVGITLTAASDVAFVELPWRPGDLTQAEDRCHRIGQSDTVTAWYLLAADTIEEKIGGMLDSKRAVVDKATDGTDGIAPDDTITGALMDALEKEARA